MGLTLKDELLKRGYKLTESTREDGRSQQEFTSDSGARIVKTGLYFSYPFTSRETVEISKDKVRGYELAEAAGMTIPVGIHTSDVAVAREFLSKYKRVVVKPHNASGSRGLTVDVTTEEQLEQAMKLATIKGEDPLIQEQFIGEELRFTIIKGKLYSAILRRSPRVTGDGVRTIQELIEDENTIRKGLVFPYLTYPQLSNKNIDTAFMSNQTIPEEGEVVELSKTTMIKYGASFYGVTELVHPSYVEIAERLASKLESDLIVVDLMVVDFTVPATDSNYIFLEFNTSPSMIVYSSLRGGDNPPVVEKIADMIDEFRPSRD